MSKRRLGILAGVAAVCGLPNVASAQELEPHSLHWPLWAYDRDAGTYDVPRLGATNANGNFQGDSYDAAYLARPLEDRGPYLHPGVDIRGLYQDVVRVPATANVWLSNADTDFCPQNAGNTQCRVYMLDGQKRYVYYFSHIDYAANTAASGDTVRTAIQNALQQQEAYLSSAEPTDPAILTAVAADTELIEGHILGASADFPGYHHLHFGIFDLQSNFDMLDPLLYLEREPAPGYVFVDDEPPTVHEFHLESEAPIAGQGTPVVPSGACHELNGGTYDAIAEMSDTLSTDQGLIDQGEGFAANSVTKARFIIQPAHGMREVREWYDFARLPITCVGDWSVGACTTTWLDYFDVLKFTSEELANPELRAGVLGADAGALLRDQLFAFGTMSSLSNPTYNHYYQVLTHSWGTPGSWNVADYPDGLYYLTAEAEDGAGNKDARSLQVVVNKSGAPLGAGAVADVQVRDRWDDTGATPSNAGNQPFWESPDIILRAGDDYEDVITAPDPSSVSPQEARVVAGQEYAVFVRVQNVGCASVSQISATVYSADPAPEPGNWGESVVGTVTSPVSVGPTAGDVGVAILGPIFWVPDADEDGHRCLLATINSALDPLGANVTDTPNDNNVAQRNLQVTGPYEFSIINPVPDWSEVSLRFDATDYPTTTDAVTLTLPNDPVFTPWLSYPGTTYSISGSALTIQFHRPLVTLPPISLPPSTGYPAEFQAEDPWDGITHYLTFTQIREAIERGGMTFEVTGSSSPT